MKNATANATISPTTTAAARSRATFRVGRTDVLGIIIVGWTVVVVLDVLPVDWTIPVEKVVGVKV